MLRDHSMQIPPWCTLFGRLPRRVAACLCCLLLLAAAGCSSAPKPDESPATEESASAVYRKIQAQMERGNFLTASEMLEQFELSFPFGAFAQNTKLDLMYSYLRSYDYDSAIETANRFLSLHQLHPQADYVHYIRGIAAYRKITSTNNFFFPADVSQQEMGRALQAFNYFQELVLRYPESDFITDVEKRMVALRNMMARHELHIANYYLKRRAWVAAANRGQYVVRHFPSAPAVPDALAIMVQSYRLLGMTDLATATLNVLASNYPGHSHVQKDGSFLDEFPEGNQRSWVNRVTMGLVDEPKVPHFDSRR